MNFETCCWCCQFCSPSAKGRGVSAKGIRDSIGTERRTRGLLLKLTVDHGKHLEQISASAAKMELENAPRSVDEECATRQCSPFLEILPAILAANRCSEPAFVIPSVGRELASGAGMTDLASTRSRG